MPGAPTPMSSSGWTSPSGVRYNSVGMPINPSNTYDWMDAAEGKARPGSPGSPGYANPDGSVDYGTSGNMGNAGTPGTYAPPSSAAASGGGGGGGEPSFMNLNSGLTPRVVSTTGRGMGTAAGGGTMSGGNSNILQSLLQNLQQQGTKANSDSLAQYNNLLGSVKGTTNTVNGLYGQMNGLLDTQGQTALAQQGIKNQNNLGQADQDMTQRGLGNTTIRTSALSGVNRDNSMATNAIQEGVNAGKIGLGMQQAQGQMQLGQMNGDAILSRQNQAPNMNQYLSLIQQLAASSTRGNPSAGFTGYSI